MIRWDRHGYGVHNIGRPQRMPTSRSRRRSIDAGGIRLGAKQGEEKHQAWLEWSCWMLIGMTGSASSGESSPRLPSPLLQDEQLSPLGLAAGDKLKFLEAKKKRRAVAFQSPRCIIIFFPWKKKAGATSLIYSFFLFWCVSWISDRLLISL